MLKVGRCNLLLYVPRLINAVGGVLLDALWRKQAVLAPRGAL